MVSFFNLSEGKVMQDEQFRRLGAKMRIYLGNIWKNLCCYNGSTGPEKFPSLKKSSYTF